MAALTTAYEARAREIESQKRANLAIIDDLGRHQTAATLVWIKCQSAYAARLGRETGEPTDVIALAAFSACGAEEHDLRRIVGEMGRFSTDHQYVDNIMAGLRDASKERMTKEILDIRHGPSLLPRAPRSDTL